MWKEIGIGKLTNRSEGQLAMMWEEDWAGAGSAEDCHVVIFVASFFASKDMFGWLPLPGAYSPSTCNDRANKRFQVNCFTHLTQFLKDCFWRTIFNITDSTYIEERLNRSCTQVSGTPGVWHWCSSLNQRPKSSCSCIMLAIIILY